MKKVIIAGSRSFNDYTLLKETLDNLLNKPFIIVSGGAKGADTLAELYAKEYNLECEVHKAKWNDLTVKDCIPKHNKYGTYNSLAGMNRNKEMLDSILENKEGGLVIAFWDGISSCTNSMINIARKGNIKVKIIYV